MSSISELEAKIDEQIAAAQGYASNAIVVANTVTDALADVLENINPNHQVGWATINQPQWNDLAKVDGADKPGELDLSKANGIIDAGLNKPSLYTPGELPILTPYFIPQFTTDSPILELPNRPDSGTFVAPSSEEISTLEIPVAPDYTLPDVPVLASLTIPDAPDIAVIPPFEMAIPTFDISAPAPVLVYNEGVYQSELQDAANAWLQRVIASGGYGLDGIIEQAIWDRAMTREAESARRNMETAQDEFASAGFPMPTGALRARVRELRADLQNRSEDLSRKIMEDQGRLALANIQFAIDKSLQLEALTMQHFNSVADRALKYAMAASELASAIFNIQIAEFNTRMEAYKISAQVYEINVRAALQEIEIYKTLLEGKQIEGNLRMQDIKLYSAQIEGITALFGLYRTQLEGVKIEGDIERLKIDIFKAEMDGYVAQIRAKESEFASYRSQIEAEKVKFDAFDSQVRAYTAQVHGESARIDAEKTHIQATIELEKAKLQQKQYELENYKVGIQRNQAAIEATISAYRANSDVYKAELARAEAEGRLGMEGLRIEQEASKFNQTVINNKFAKEADILLQMTNAGISASSSALNAQANIAASALSQINTISQLAGNFDTVDEA